MDSEKLIIENIPLINLMIKELHCSWQTEDEYQNLYDYGLDGLIKGAQTYNESKGKPSTYLCTCIKNMILRYFCVKKLKKNFNEKGFDLSLNKIISDEGKEVEFGDLIADPDVNVEEEVEKKLKIERLINAVNNLQNEKDKIVIKMYYGIDGYTEVGSYEKIGQQIGVTRGSIRFRLKRAEKKIKEYLEKNDRDLIKKEPIKKYTSNKIEKGKIMENNNEVVLTQKQEVNPLNEINTILMEQLQRLRTLDTSNKTKSNMEIARSNAISTASKTILQTVGIQIMAQKTGYNIPLIENKQCQEVE